MVDGANEMAQWAKEFIEQAWQPEFNIKIGKKQTKQKWNKNKNLKPNLTSTKFPLTSTSELC